MSGKKSKGPVIDPGLCRCCGSMKRCRLLNVEYENEGDKEVYSDMIMDCFGLLLSHLDGKPMECLICATCVQRLRAASAFKKQVLKWEEVFLQMKIVAVDEETSKIIPDNDKLHPLFDGPPKVEIDIVKIEEPSSDAVGDFNEDYDMGCADSQYSLQQADEDSNSNDSLPLIKRKKSKEQQLKTNTKKCPTNNTAKRINNKCDGIKKIEPAKPEIPMSKMQQIIRESDPSYMTETNILTIIEYSYVCPFRCRHNNLLCYYCGMQFADPTDLRDHTMTCHHPKRFKITEHKNMVKVDITRIDCRLCPETVDNLEEFKKHISTVHNKKYYFDYKDSILPFQLTKEELKCTLCDVVFLYFHALNKHMNEHFSNYVCETCGLGFVDNGRFVMHQQRHEVADFPCEVCGKIFKAQYNRDLHIDRVHKKKGRVYCPKCDVKLMSYPQKLKHLVEVHGEQPLRFPCDMCDKIYDTRRMLTIHRRKDHLKDYRYTCQSCGQKFFTRFALNNHMPVHTGERNFQCKVCEKSYPRLKTLKDHMRIHTNDRRYRCHVCGQAFIQNCSLKGHMKSQHPEYG